MASTIKEIIETENSITVISEDKWGEIHSETVEHNGSSWSRNDAKDTAIERACNH